MLRRLLIPALALLVAGCSFGPYRNHGAPGPDAQLAALVDALRSQRAEGGAMPDANGQVVLDSDAVRHAIETLALDFPGHQPTLMVCALLAHEAGDVEEALGYLDLLLSHAAADPAAAALRARIALEQGDLPAARRLLDRELQLHPSSPDLREAAAALAWLEGRADDARAQLREAQRFGAPEWRIAYDLGLVAESSHDAAGAQREYERALALKPGWSLAAERLAAARAP